jgi:hypothetical protein
MVPLRVDTIVISTQHMEEISTEKLRKEILEKIVCQVIPAHLLDERTIYHVSFYFMRICICAEKLFLDPAIGTFRHWQTAGRCRAHWSQDYRRHLWRLECAPEWIALQSTLPAGSVCYTFSSHSLFFRS